MERHYATEHTAAPSKDGSDDESPVGSEPVTIDVKEPGKELVFKGELLKNGGGKYWFSICNWLWEPRFCHFTRDGHMRYWTTGPAPRFRKSVKVASWGKVLHARSVKLKRKFLIDVHDANDRHYLLQAHDAAQYEALVGALDQIQQKAKSVTFQKQDTMRRFRTLSHVRSNSDRSIDKLDWIDGQYYAFLFDEADTSKDGKISVEELGSMLVAKNIGLVGSQLSQAFAEVDADGSGDLDLMEFLDVMARLNHCQPLEDLFARINHDSQLELADTAPELNDPTVKDAKTLSYAQLLHFFRGEQQQPGLGPQELHTVVADLREKMHWEPRRRSTNPLSASEIPVSMSLFGALLRRPMNAFMPLAIEQDLTRPLSHYLISSSHNTYLTGDQLVSRSAVDMYHFALKAGYKCVEIDVWDGSREDMEPVVTHGHTLTSKILLKDVLAAIMESAFAVSPLPVVLSLEVRCGDAFVERLCDHLEAIVGSALYLPEDGEELPSPAALQGKVLVKGKTKNERLDSLSFIKGVKDKKALVKQWHDGVSVPEGSTAAECISTPEGMLEDPSLDKLTLQAYHRRSLTRTYPAPTRVASGNYNPVPCWARGAQLVALNVQAADREVSLNQALFGPVQFCGYRLKPAGLLQAPPGPAPAQHLVWHCTIEIICGFYLPKPRGESEKSDVVDPKVALTLWSGGTGKTTTWRTRTIPANGFNPVWQEKWSFVSEDPEEDMLLVEVWDEERLGDDFVGYNAAPVADLREGTRYMQIRAKGGEILVSQFEDIKLPGLLVHFAKEQAPRGAAPQGTPRAAQ